MYFVFLFSEYLSIYSTFPPSVFLQLHLGRDQSSSLCSHLLALHPSFAQPGSNPSIIHGGWRETKKDGTHLKLFNKLKQTYRRLWVLIPHNSVIRFTKITPKGYPSNSCSCLGSWGVEVHIGQKVQDTWAGQLSIIEQHRVKPGSHLCSHSFLTTI